MTSTLMVHNPKFDAKLTSLPDLRVLPAPVAMGPHHKPVPHARLIDALLAEADRRGYLVGHAEFALASNKAALFGVLDLTPKAHLAPGERGLSFGFRNSTNESLGLKAVCGTRVFVCDNLMLSGSMFAMDQKNTTGLDLGDAVARGFDKFLAHADLLETQIARLQASFLTDGQAKQLAYEVFALHIVPSRLLDDVDDFYFRPTADMTDCYPRSQWGLVNAFTRAMQDLTPVRAFGATVALGNYFGLRSV
jgi:hypothetical protein